MAKFILVGAGGFVGAILRYMLAGCVQHLTQSIAFPYGTLVVNLTGCFFIGMFSYLVESQAGITAEMRLFFMVGLLGAFTTYSTFGNETFALLQDQRIILAFLNMGVHLAFGLSCVVLGRFAIMTIWR